MPDEPESLSTEPTGSLPGPADASTGAGITARRADAEQSHVQPDARVPQRIGRYTILRILGEGGMGTVYEAQQESPKRTVALKVIRAGYLSPQLLRRFEHESQVLGRLQHPGIAQVYEAGTVQVGRRGDLSEPGVSPSTPDLIPFFAMEFIRGIPLTDYAQQNNLTTRARLDLIARICDAVYHAHQKGVIHRDLKPANILVDESGQPKILDFGVARATNSDIQQTTIQTDIGQLIGTVPYMSPEQVSGDPDNLDTRSDVYALGVIAYELLAGRLPHDLRKKMIHEAARIIKEEEPTRLSSINKALRGDIETIVAKALEKDKIRRYQSAESLGSDIRRYLKDEPITARPASTWYQARKFGQRNKGLVAGVGAAFAVLVVGLVVSLYAFAEAKYERDEKGKALVLATENEQKAKDEADAATKARDAADEARKRAEAINEFVTKSLQSSDPNQGGMQAMTVADAMTQALANLDKGDLKDQPAMVAALLRTIAGILNGNGKSAEAESPAERALEIERELHPADHPDVAGSLNKLAVVRQSLGRGAEAEPLYMQALEMWQRLFTGDYQDVAAGMHNLASARQSLGRAAEAEPLFLQALEMQQRLFKGDHPDVALSLNDLAAVRELLGRPTEAEPMHMQALEMRKRLFNGDHPKVAQSLINLAHVRQSLGHAAEAEPLCVQALEMWQRLFKGDHPSVAVALNNLASVRQSLDRASEAEPLFVQALEMNQRLFKGDHPDVAQCLNNVAAVHRALGREAEAEPLYMQALEMRQRLFTGDHPDVAWSLNNLAGMRNSLGRAAEAEPLFMQTLEMRQRLFKGDHSDVAASLIKLAQVRQLLGRAAKAEPLFVQALEMNQRLFKGDHPDVAGTTMSLARCLAALDRLPEALARAQDAADMAARILPEGHPTRKKCDDTLAEIKKTMESQSPAGDPVTSQPPPGSE